MKNEMPKGKSILALKRLAGTKNLVLMYRGITLYTGVIVTPGAVLFTKLSIISRRAALTDFASIVWNAIFLSPSAGYDSTLFNLTSDPA
jgi:hypothetical protein